MSDRCGLCNRANSEMLTDDTCIGCQLDDARKRIRDLEALALVLDCTISCLHSVRGEGAELFDGQVEAYREAHLNTMGEESMVGFKRGETKEEPCDNSATETT